MKNLKGKIIIVLIAALIMLHFLGIERTVLTIIDLAIADILLIWLCYKHLK